MDGATGRGLRDGLPAGEEGGRRVNRRSLVQTARSVGNRTRLWIGYGILKSDYVIIVANTVGFALVATLIGFKIRDAR